MLLGICAESPENHRCWRVRYVPISHVLNQILFKMPPFLVLSVFIYIHTMCMHAAKAQASLRVIESMDSMDNHVIGHLRRVA